MWEIQKLFQIKVSGAPFILLFPCTREQLVGSLYALSVSNEHSEWVWTIASSQGNYFKWRFQMVQLIIDVKWSLQQVWNIVWEIQECELWELACAEISKRSLQRVWNKVWDIQKWFQIQVSVAPIPSGSYEKVNVCSPCTRVFVQEQLFGSLCALRVSNDNSNECEQ